MTEGWSPAELIRNGSAMLQNEDDNGVNSCGIAVDSFCCPGPLRRLLSVLVPLLFHTPALWLLPRACYPQGPPTYSANELQRWFWLALWALSAPHFGAKLKTTLQLHSLLENCRVREQQFTDFVLRAQHSLSEEMTINNMLICLFSSVFSPSVQSQTFQPFRIILKLRLNSTK